MMRPCSDRGIFRFLAMAILIALAVTLAVALPGVSADGGEAEAAPIPRSGGTSGDNQAPPIPDKAALNYPNLGSHLDELVAKVEGGQATAKDAAGETSVHSGESVAVTIYLTGNVDDVVTFLEDNGGDPRNVGEDYIEAYVPVTLLGQLSQQPGVIRVREIVPPEPDFGPITSQGVGAHLATAWHEAGITGEGVKVGNNRRRLRGVPRPYGNRDPNDRRGQVLHRLWSAHAEYFRLRKRGGSWHGCCRVALGYCPGGFLVYCQPYIRGRLAVHG